MRFEEELLLKQQERIDHINKSVETPIEDYLEKGFESEDVDIIKSLNTLIESFIEERIDDSIFEKAMAGIYADTSENKKLGRVGQKYGSEGKQDDKKESRDKVTGVDFEHLKRFNLTEEYVNKLIPHMLKNVDSTKKFIQNLDKLANKLGEQKGNQAYNEAKNLRNLKVYLLHKMFE